MSDDIIERIPPLRVVLNQPDGLVTELAPDELWNDSCGPGAHEYVVPVCRRCGAVLHPEEP